MINLATRYPDGIFIVGSSLPALEALVELLEKKLIAPTLVIATPPELMEPEKATTQLSALGVPMITIRGGKGSAVVAVAIVNALVNLAWQAYEQKAQTS